MKNLSNLISVKLDRIDKHIIRALQQNGRIQNNDLAKEIDLSPSSWLRRVKLLEDAVVITHIISHVSKIHSFREK